MAFALGCFLWPSFCRTFPWSQLCRILEKRAEDVLAKFAIARLYGHFGSRGLLQNVVLCWHLKCIVIWRLWLLRQGVFSGLLLAGLFTGRNFAEF